MQHAASHTAAVQPSSHVCVCVLLTKNESCDQQNRAKRLPVEYDSRT